MQRRRIASIAAAEALEEAILTESVVRNLRYSSDSRKLDRIVDDMNFVELSSYIHVPSF